MAKKRCLDNQSSNWKVVMFSACLDKDAKMKTKEQKGRYCMIMLPVSASLLYLPSPIIY